MKPDLVHHGLQLGTACLMALAVTGCGSNKEQKAPAPSEILEGSVSDAMLPLDTVRSQPPLAPPTGSASDSPSAREPEEAGKTDTAAGKPSDAAEKPKATDAAADRPTAKQ